MHSSCIFLFFEKEKKVNTLKNVLDERFGIAIKDFEFTVPFSYDHETQLDTFALKTKNLPTTRYFSGELISANFKNTTSMLVPGKTYRVRIFPVLEKVGSDDCVTFLRKQEAFLVGGQGITLLADKNGNEFPVGKWTVSFDEKDALWEDSEGNHMFPNVGRHTDGGMLFCLGSFERGLHGDYCLLCFSEK